MRLGDAYDEAVWLLAHLCVEHPEETGLPTDPGRRQARLLTAPFGPLAGRPRCYSDAAMSPEALRRFNCATVQHLIATVVVLSDCVAEVDAAAAAASLAALFGDGGGAE